MIERHKSMIVAIDLMFINKIPFVMTISQNLHFGIADLISETKAELS